MPRKKFSDANLDTAIKKSRTTKRVDFAVEKPAGERADLEMGIGVAHDGERVDVDAAVSVKTDGTKKKTAVRAKGTITF